MAANRSILDSHAQIQARAAKGEGNRNATVPDLHAPAGRKKMGLRMEIAELGSRLNSMFRR